MHAAKCFALQSVESVSVHSKVIQATHHGYKKDWQLMLYSTMMGKPTF